MLCLFQKFSEEKLSKPRQSESKIQGEFEKEFGARALQVIEMSLLMPRRKNNTKAAALEKTILCTLEGIERRLNVSLEAQANEILCYLKKIIKLSVHNRFIRGLFAVYHRNRERSFYLAAHQWTEVFLSLLTLFIPGMSGNITIVYQQGERRSSFQECRLDAD